MINLGNRSQYIGGSDIPVIKGVSPFKSRKSLLNEKIQGITQDEDNAVFKFGHEFETVLIDDFLLSNEDYEVVDLEEVKTRLFDFPIITHFDKVVKDKKDNRFYLIECKTSKNKFNGELPEYYNYQVQFYLYIINNFTTYNIEEAIILFGLRSDTGELSDYENFTVKYEPDFYKNNIQEDLQKFINEVLQGREVLPNTNSAIAKLDLAALDKLIESKELIEAKIKEFNESLLKVMQEAKVSNITVDGYKITVVDSYKRSSFDKKQAEIEEPEKAKEFEAWQKKFQKESTVKASIKITKTNKE